MLIAIMTSEESFINNYGAVLQSYALYNVLLDMGHTAMIIRYRGGSPDEATLWKSLYRGSNRLFHKYFRIAPEKKIYKKDIKIQEHCFKQFQKKNLSFWNRFRSEWLWLKHHYPDADIYICGSDQIWNPNYKAGNNDPGYFLDFAPAGKKRIAYAPSFACDDIPESAQKDLKYYLNKFSAISVRESEGAHIIKKYADMMVPIVADPTFLLTRERWNTIANISESTPEKYILCYRFMENDEMSRCIEFIRNKLEIPVITLPLSYVAMKDPYQKLFNTGPEEFIGLIRNASLVCTDSFHATAFSLIMNTPFYTFLDNDAAGRGTNMNSRVRNVIEIAGLENRVIRKKREIDINKVLDVDFTHFNRKIMVVRNESLAWLKNALEVKM